MNIHAPTQKPQHDDTIPYVRGTGRQGPVAGVGLPLFMQAQSRASVSEAMLQRQCACASTLSANDACEACNSDKPLQAKLAIGASDDPLEQEADRVADQVLAMPANSAVSGVPPRIQRYAGQASGKSGAIPASVDRVLAGNGRPLDATLKQDMEQRFGHDFSNVRVHSGSEAAQSARDVNARAYTVGTQIVLGANEGAMDTIAGRRLLAHELTHTLQQQGSTVPRGVAGRIQRSPYTGFERGSEDLHERLGDEYAANTGALNMGALQYTQGYAQWIKSKTVANVGFIRPPTFVPVNPLERLRKGQPTGSTTLIINGQRIDGSQMGTNLSLIEAQLRPPDVVQAPGIVTGQVSCRFGPKFCINTSTEVIEASMPTAKGWQARLPSAALGNPAACAGKVDVPVTLRGQNSDSASDQAYHQLVHDSEMEHVQALEELHNRHFVPYYNFVKMLSATAGNVADCEVALRQRINDRDKQAAYAFALADAAEAKRLDAPLSTHQGNLSLTVAPGCTTATLIASQKYPLQAGAGPGNVHPVPPQIQAVNIANLSVNGSALMDGATLIRTFNSPADAATAMGMMATYGITESHRIGPFEMLLSNGQAPSGALAGIPGLDIDPDALQVTIGFPNDADWVISQMVGAKFFSIVDFGAQRDRAYAAVELIRRHRFTRQSWIGPAAAPQMMFFTV